MPSKQWWKTIPAYIIGPLLCLIVLLGCKEEKRADQAQKKAFSPAPRYGGTYHKALRQEPLTLDPAFSTDIFSTSVAHQVFDGLIQFDADLHALPSLAQSWHASYDSLVWTFFLRQGVKFHHGREVTADDFVYAFTRLLDPRIASPHARLLEHIQGAKQFLAGETTQVPGIRAVDAYTLQITLTQPYAPFLSILGMAQVKVVPREEVERLGAQFGRQPVGTGPFRFVNWVAGQEITLEANETYFEGRPFLDRLSYRMMANHQGMTTAFAQGALEDVELTGQEQIGFGPDSQVQFLRKPLLATLFLWFDLRQGPLSHPKVRQAINYAINRDAMVRTIRHDRHVQARGVLPRGMPGYHPELPGYRYDVTRARQLLVEAGYPEGQGVAPLELWSSVTTPAARQEDAWIQRDLAHIGLRVTLLSAENWKHFKTTILGQRPGAMYRHAWFADFPDPDNVLFPLFHSQSTNNYAHYRNPIVDRLLEQARSTSDYLSRIDLYRQAEALIVADAPAVNLVYYTLEYMFQPYVHGVELNALGERYIPMKKIWLDVTHRAFPAKTSPP